MSRLSGALHEEGSLSTRVPRHTRISVYAFAIGLSTAAVGARLLLQDLFGSGNWFIQSHPAVLLSAWVGGVGPGLAATAFSAVADTYLFVPPQFSFRKGGQASVALTFTAIGALISYLVGALRSSRALAIEATRRAEAAAAERGRLLHAALEANRAKDEFLATLSHELRTPLNAAFGWAYVLKSAALPPDAAKAAEAIHRNCELQKRLVDDMLDFSRIVTGRLDVNLDIVDFSALVTEVAASFAPTVELKRQHLESHIAPACSVRGDPDRLRQIVWNLLSNASKFSPANSVITVEVREVRDDVLFSVVDRGIGIDPQFLPHIFEPFRQLDGSTTRQHGGLGLGLALVQRLVEAHGGSIRARSGGLGQGTTIDVRLPGLSAAVAHQPAGEHAQSEERPQGRLGRVSVATGRGVRQ